MDAVTALVDVDRPRGGRAVPRVAVVLFNLGGPDRIENVRPFLYNLFSDRAIIRAPSPIRQLLAWLITKRRLGPATENYEILGGGSPLLELTEEQARALEKALRPEIEARCFVAMRYWHPMSEEAAKAVRDWGPDEVILLPLYPQFSTTTSGSSLDAWREAAVKVGLVAPTKIICCYHSDPGFVGATAAIVRRAYDQARADLDPSIPLRVLFSAHGLPESIVKAGDPYQWQVEQTVASVVAAMDIPELDHVVCYQSRVTPQKWIGPSTEEEIKRAGKDGVAILVVPIAFVSEHSETLVELDIEYREEAKHFGVPAYFRAPAHNADAGFIASLASLVRRARGADRSLCSFRGGRTCPKEHADCPHAKRASAPVRRVSVSA